MAWPVPVATVGLAGYRPAALMVARPVALLAHPAVPAVVVTVAGL